MVMDSQHRPYGAMGGYEHMYAQQAPPQFHDPWAAANATQHSSTPSHTLYSTSAAQSQPIPISSMKDNRPTAISLPYTAIPVSGPSMVPSNSFATSNYSPMHHQAPQTTGYATESTYATSASPTHSFPTNYSMAYAHSLQHQQQQQRDDGKMGHM